jgi:hypothetical protein
LALPVIAAKTRSDLRSTHNAIKAEKEWYLEEENPEVKYSANTSREPLTGRAPNRVILTLQGLPIEVTTPQGKKLIFETPEGAAKYLPIEVKCIRLVLTGILDDTNGYKVRYFRERRH